MWSFQSGTTTSNTCPCNSTRTVHLKHRSQTPRFRYLRSQHPEVFTARCLRQHNTMPTTRSSRGKHDSDSAQTVSCANHNQETENTSDNTVPDSVAAQRGATSRDRSADGSCNQDQNTRKRSRKTEQGGKSEADGCSSSALPAGCVLGEPVAMGRAVVLVRDDESANQALMRSIQDDKYSFVRQMILSGWEPQNPSVCSFSVKMRRRDGEERWQVRDATLLHYALCCASLKAATALIIGFPALANLPCTVESSADGTTEEAEWTTVEVSRFFEGLYAGREEELHGAFAEASVVLLRLQQQPHRLPLLLLPSAQHRMAAAGSEAGEAVAWLQEKTQ